MYRFVLFIWALQLVHGNLYVTEPFAVNRADNFQAALALRFRLRGGLPETYRPLALAQLAFTFAPSVSPNATDALQFFTLFYLDANSPLNRRGFSFIGISFGNQPTSFKDSIVVLRATQDELSAAYTTVGLKYYQDRGTFSYSTIDSRRAEASSENQGPQVREIFPFENLRVVLGGSLIGSEDVEVGGVRFSGRQTFAEAPIDVGSFLFTATNLFFGVTGSNLTQIYGAVHLYQAPPIERARTAEQDSRALYLGIGIGGGLGLLILSAAAFLLVSRRSPSSLSSLSKFSSQTSGDTVGESDIMVFKRNYSAILSKSRFEEFPLAHLPPESELTEGTMLDSGFFGSVFLFEHEGRRLICKIFNLQNVQRGLRLTATDYAKELEILARLDHEHIIRCIGHQSTSDRAFLIMETAEELSLHGHIFPEVGFVVRSESGPECAAAVHKTVGQLRKILQAYYQETGCFYKYSFLMFDDPHLSYSIQGIKQLKYAAAGSCLLTTAELAAPSTATESLLSPERPVLLVVKVGSTVRSLPLSLDTALDCDAVLSLIVEMLDRMPSLSFVQRLRISVETARALTWLHTPLPDKPMLVHLDVKPQNILLSKCLSAQLADVGLSLVLPDIGPSQSYILEQPKFGQIGGTQGYKDSLTLHGARPRYGPKLDVFSLGVVLLQLFPTAHMPSLEISDAIGGLILKMVRPWKQRLSSSQVLQELERIYARVLQEAVGPDSTRESQVDMTDNPAFHPREPAVLRTPEEWRAFRRRHKLLFEAEAAAALLSGAALFQS